MTSVDLGAADPLAHGFRRRADFGRHRLDRRPLRAVLRGGLRYQPHRLRPLLRLEPDTWHGLHLLTDRSPYETQGASDCLQAAGLDPVGTHAGRKGAVTAWALSGVP